MNPGGAPHRGPAPAPSREVTLEGASRTIDVDPKTLTVSPGPPDPDLSTSPPPEDPDEAVRESTRESREGELIAALGRKQEEFEDRLEEQKLFYETQLAVLQAQGNRQTPSAQNENFDPETPVTAGYLWNILNNLDPYMENRILRGTWDVTPEEEAKILQTNPGIAQLSDGVQKTQLIKKAAQLLRKKEKSNGEVKSSTPASSKSTQPKQTRDISQRRVTPHVEASTTPSAADLRPEDGTVDIMKAYAEAGKISDKTERNRVRKELFKKAQALAGVSDEDLSRVQFRSS